MPFPDAAGWAPSTVTTPITTSPMSGFVNYMAPGYLDQYAGMNTSGDGTPLPRNATILPQEYWPSEEDYNYTAQMMLARGIQPPPRGTLSNEATQELGRALYEESRAESGSLFGMGSPGWAALVAMGGAAAGGAFGGGGSTAVPGTGTTGATGTLSPITTTATTLPGGVPAVTGAGFGATTAATPLAAMPAIGGAGAAVPTLSSGGFIENWLPHVTTGVNALLGARAADEAADLESEYLQRALDENARQFDLTRSDQMPWIEGGAEAINRLRNPATSFTTSPGYAWRRSEGERDVGNTFAARGGAASGNALRALEEFRQGLASDEYGNWFSQNLNLAGLGSDTARSVGALGSASADRSGNYLTGQGIARSSGVAGRYGAIAQGLNEGVSNYLYRRRRRAA